MDASSQRDKTYHFIMDTFVRRGYAPHYTEIASKFGVGPEDGRRMLHDLMSLNSPMWLYPNTDLIASFAPFNNIPTQYLVSIDGHQQWFAQ